MSDPDLAQKACALYEAGASAVAVGKRLGRSHSWVYGVLERAGIPRRAPNHGRAAPIDRGAVEEMVRAGAATSEIARAQGCDRGTLMKWMKRWGMGRSKSEAAKIRHQRIGPEGRAALVASAHETRRGATLPEETVRRMVAAQAGVLKSDLERQVFAYLCEAGLQPSPGWQVERFLVDIAFPEKRVAVEVDGGNWHATPKKQSQDRRKAERLTALGWTILRIGSADPAGLDELIARLEAAGCHPSVGGEERVLGADRDAVDT